VYPNALSSEFSLLQGDAVIARLRDCLAGTQPGDAHVDPRFYGLSVADAALLNSLLPANPLSAAVLVPLIAHPTGPTLMFTERASGLRKHGGQISFPGGRVEPDDNGPVGGALRESAEEIGLGAGFVEVIGYLPDHLVITGFRVTPVVGLVAPGFTLAPDANEVASVFEVPLAFFLDPANRVKAWRKLGGQIDAEIEEFHWEGRRIWGATASMVISLAEKLEWVDG
jgi:8-oxo-dGTP pyrophosphatase MutT (NUDIX family)